MTDEHSLWLAAVLHDIGKFWENTPPTDVPTYLLAAQRYNHEAYSAWFVQKYLSSWTQDQQAVEQMILKHHQASLPDELLVQLADWLASYERVEAPTPQQGGKGKRETLLRSVLSRVKGANTALYHPLRSLQLERQTLFPQPEQVVPSPPYARVWEQFTEDLQKVPVPHLRSLQALLFKHFWAAPSDRSYDNIPDISLYYHMVATAAIAICLARTRLNEADLQVLGNALKSHLTPERDNTKTSYTPQEERLLHTPIALLVKGDISSTQQFLYLLTSRGAARGLRGRSFYLQLLTEVISEWILRKLHLPLTNRLYVGGGHFYLLIPAANQEELEQLRAEIAHKLWQAHRGDLSLNIGDVPVAPLDFVSEQAGGRGFAKKWQEVAEQLEARKRQRWMDMGAEQMAQYLFTPHEEGTTAEQMCHVCHGEWRHGEDPPAVEDIRKCARCFSFEELGRQLRDPEYLIYFLVEECPLPPRPRWDQVLRAFGAEVHLLNRREDGGLQIPQVPHDASEVRIERVDHTDFLCQEALQLADQLRVRPAFDFRLLATATPYDEHKQQVADYDYLANASQGVGWLGVLRMDVDSLGDLFHHGLGNDATLSRMATLSGSLRLFFEAYVPWLCAEFNRTRREKVYLLYAGGDDLFVVGSWSILPELAKRIREEFREYVGGDHVTLSAGIAVEHEKYPLYRLADDAKHALDEQAKRFKHTDGREKDAIGFLGKALGWEQFAEVYYWKEELLAMLRAANDKGKIPRALLNRLMEISALYQRHRILQEGRRRRGEITEQQYRSLVDHDRWRWRLIYHLSRFAQSYQQHEQALQNLKEALTQKGLIQNIHIAARWAELLTREGD